jgi:predicted nucleic acid-binding protein
VTVFIDTAVIMYAAGRGHEMREPCRRILVTNQQVEGVTSAEVIQEIFHRFTILGDRGSEARMATAALDLFNPVLAITDAILRHMPDLLLEHNRVSARDLVHVATWREAGIDAIVSPDRAFDEVAGLSRIDPLSRPFG